MHTTTQRDIGAMRKRRVQLLVRRHGWTIDPRFHRQGVDLRCVAGCHAPLAEVAEAADLGSCGGGQGACGRRVGCVGAVGGAFAVG